MQNMRSRLFDRTNTGIGGIFMAKGKISAKQEENDNSSKTWDVIIAMIEL